MDIDAHPDPPDIRELLHVLRNDKTHVEKHGAFGHHQTLGPCRF